MANEVKLPRLGQGMEAGTVNKWLKSEGDTVAKGEPLFEVDTDKVTQEVESDVDGVLLEIVVREGEVQVGSTIAMIEPAGGAAVGEAPPAADENTSGKRKIRSTSSEKRAILRSESGYQSGSSKRPNPFDEKSAVKKNKDPRPNPF